jgi:hypothetical protein
MKICYLVRIPFFVTKFDYAKYSILQNFWSKITDRDGFTDLAILCEYGRLCGTKCEMLTDRA